MEKNLLKKENLNKSKEKANEKREILVKKRINILNRLSMAKSPHGQPSNIIKSKKNEKIDKQILKKNKIQQPSELINKKKNVDFILNQKNSKNFNSNNNQFGIKDKNNILKKITMIKKNY